MSNEAKPTAEDYRQAIADTLRSKADLGVWNSEDAFALEVIENFAAEVHDTARRIAGERGGES